MRNLILSAWCVLTLLGVANAQQSRPNIVFLFDDDYGKYASVYAQHEKRPTANSLIETPNIDALATEGVLFLNAHVNSPSCTPCRSSLLSGQYFWRTGRGALLQSAMEWDSSIPTYPLLLESSGYDIAFVNKVWSPGEPKDAPYGGEANACYADGRPQKMGQFGQNVTKMMKRGLSKEKAKQIILDEVEEDFQFFLSTKRKGENPYAYWFGPKNCHRGFERGSGKQIWGLNPDDLKGLMPGFLPDVHEIREDFSDYLGECMAFDASVGLFVRMLKETGEWDNTILVVSGDHGAPGFPRAKTNLYEFGTAVTLVVAGGPIEGGRVVEDFVNLPDLTPTFLEFAGVEVPDVMTGKSLVNVLTSKQSGLVDPERTFVVTGRERHVDTAREGFKPYPQRAIRTEDYVYIINFEPDREPIGTLELGYKDLDNGPTKRWILNHLEAEEWADEMELGLGKRPREELYVIANDPDEVINEAANPAYAEIKEELSEQLMTILIDSEDPRVTEDPVLFETPPFLEIMVRGAKK